MALNHYFIFSAIALSILSGCGVSIFEPAEVNLPEIEILSVAQDASTTLVTVDIQGGSALLELAGVAYGEQADFQTTDQQVIYQVLQPGTYDLPIGGLTPERQYYLRAFVRDEFAYAESQTASFLVPRPEAPTIPCTLVRNQIRDEGLTFNEPRVSATTGSGGGGRYGARIESGIGGPIITLNFASVPNSGIYQTSDFNTLATSAEHVFISYQRGFVQGSAQVDQAVYVEKLGDQQYLISFCDISYTISGSSGLFSFTGQVEVN